MLNVIHTFTSILSSPNHWYETSVVLGDGDVLADENWETILVGGEAILVTDGSPESGYRDSELFSVETTAATLDSTPAAGGTCAAECKIVMLKPHGEIPPREKIRIFTRLTNGTEYSEWIPKGTFYIDSRKEYPANTYTKLELHGYDSMLLLEADYPADSKLDWPATDLSVAAEIASSIGLELDDRCKSVMTAGWTINLPTVYSCREVLGYIGSSYAANWIVTDDGKLLIVPLVGFQTEPHQVNLAVSSLDTPKALTAYSQIAVQAEGTDSTLEYTHGNESGNTLTVSTPFGSQAIADWLYANSGVIGYAYQPFTASGAVLSPVAELGDKAAIGNVIGVIQRRVIRFGKGIRQDISAPGAEEVDEAVPYKSTETRKIERTFKSVSSRFEVVNDRITAEVSARTESVNELGSQIESLNSSLSVQSDRITAEVSARTESVNELGSQIESLNSSLSVQAGLISACVTKSGGDSSSFGWELTSDAWTIKSGGGTVLQVNANGAYISGEVQAKTGKIGGLTLQDGALQTWWTDGDGITRQGLYIGADRLSLGTAFTVDNQGNLNATSGTFSGAVYANGIQYGDVGGYVSGGALSDMSIGGGKIDTNAIVNRHITSGSIWPSTCNSTINDYFADIIYAKKVVSGSVQTPSLWARQVNLEQIRIGDPGSGQAVSLISKSSANYVLGHA